MIISCLPCIWATAKDNQLEAWVADRCRHTQRQRSPVSLPCSNDMLRRHSRCERVRAARTDLVAACRSLISPHPATISFRRHKPVMDFALLSGGRWPVRHVAGSAALVLSVHPDWSPAQVESALIGTGACRQCGGMQDGITPVFAPRCRHRSRAARARSAGRFVSAAFIGTDFLAGGGTLANPTQHGDLAKLNRAGIENENCFGHCSFSRTVTDMSNGGTWQVTASATTGAVFFKPTQFTLAAGGSQNRRASRPMSAILICPATGSAAASCCTRNCGGRNVTDSALTVAAYATPEVAQAFQQFTANAPGGYVDGAGQRPCRIAERDVCDDDAGASQCDADDIGGRHGIVRPGLQSRHRQAVRAVSDAGFEQFRLVSRYCRPRVHRRDQRVECRAGRSVRRRRQHNDGTPEASEQACKTSFSSVQPVARCIIDLHDVSAGTGNVWALVDVLRGGPGATYSRSR